MRRALGAALLALAACSEEKAAETPALTESPLADSAALQARAIAEADGDVRAAEAAEARAASAKPPETAVPAGR